MIILIFSITLFLTLTKVCEFLFLFFPLSMMTYGDEYGNSVKANNFVNLRIATYLKMKLCVVVSSIRVRRE